GVQRGAVAAPQRVHAEHDLERAAALLEHRDLVDQARERQIVAEVAVDRVQAGRPAGLVVRLALDLEVLEVAHRAPEAPRGASKKSSPGPRGKGLPGIPRGEPENKAEAEGLGLVLRL